MTRRTSTSLRLARPRRAKPPTRRAARGQLFTSLGFAFFRLVSLGDRGPDEPRYTAMRLSHPRSTMTAFVAALS